MARTSPSSGYFLEWGADRAHDHSFLLLVNAEDQGVEFTLPSDRQRKGWKVVIDSPPGAPHAHL